MNDTEEIFIQVSDPIYSLSYSVSNLGNVKSMKRNKCMKQWLRNGYNCVGLSHEGISKNFMVHRLVALAFIENPCNHKIVNHIDGNRLNNFVSNLEWTSYSGNVIHSMNVLDKKKSGTPVVQLSMDGTIINTFPSVKDAESCTKVSAKKISSVCTGLRGSTGGFKWVHLLDQEDGIPEGKTFPDYSHYIITRCGKVYSLRAKRFMYLNVHNSGYVSVCISNGKKKDFYVHVLVAKLFLDPVDGKEYVNHIDRDKSNNNVDNLEWVTASENNLHKFSTDDNVYKRKVVKCDLEGVHIKEYDKIGDASNECNIDSSSIVRVCKGKQKTTGGYIWKYVL